MDNSTIIMLVVSMISCMAAIYQCVYATRNLKRGNNMRELRSFLAAWAILLTFGSVGLVFISPWFVCASFAGLACGALDRYLKKYDLDQEEQMAMDKFLTYDVEARNLILKAVDLNQRILVCEERDHPVTIDGSIYFDVDPLDVSQMAAQEFLAACGQDVETVGKGLDSRIVKTFYYAVSDDARRIACLVKEQGLVNKYGLMEEKEE